MVRRKKLSRRRDDDRVETKPDYALIQDTADVFIEELAIPNFSEGSSDQNIDSVEALDKSVACDPVENDFPSSRTGGSNAHVPHVFALVGATGGVGTTSLATQLAHEFATSATSGQLSRRRPTDPTVCLIDLDFESGACAHHLDLLPSLSLDDLCGPPEHIDKAFTQALVSTHECGVSLLAVPNTIGANARINPHTVMAMLDAATELYDTVIIDLPRYRQPWMLPIMRAVDVFGIACELTIPSLHATRERLARLAHEANGQVNAQVILSKYERRSFKSTLRLGDAETALGRSIMATICLDPDTTRESLNCGEPAGAVRPDSRFVKDVRKLVSKLRAQNINTVSKVA